MLTQDEADAFLALQKQFVTHPGALTLDPGSDQTHHLVAANREEFLLDLWRGTIRLSKIRLQTRARVVYPLVRLDIDGAPHTNPDGVRLGGTHLHRYREGFEDRWAFPPDPVSFANLHDPAGALLDFCRYCRIEHAPVQGPLA